MFYANLSGATRGYILGFIGVAIFSLTLPFTHIAVKELDPVFVSVGRTVAAGICAIVILLATRQPWPEAGDIWRLGIVVCGVVLGFPILSSLAMKTAPASHGSVVLALLPLGTALMGTVFAGERPTRQFWLWSVLGSTCVIVYALWDGGRALQGADMLLVLSVIAASMGYAAGGALSRKLGGWQVICWALVGALPVTIPVAAFAWRSDQGSVSMTSWACFAYLGLMSQLVGFFAWNKGLALGGVAKVGQVQLLQTFMTQLAAFALLGEQLSLRSLVFAGLVALCVWFGRKSQVKVA